MPSISADRLRNSLENAQPPLVIDVRRRDDYLESSVAISGALRRDPDKVASWADELPAGCSAVVYCVHGGAASQSVAEALQSRRIETSYLEGGINAWRAANGP